MNKIPHMYSQIQMDEIQKFITDHFGEGDGYIAHEIKSEYVHTDSMIVKTEDQGIRFVTFGMGARKMDAPDKVKRCELVMSATKNMELPSKESFIISGELARISKFPFREDTWFGTGHTIGASEEFKKAFGYDAFAFCELSLSANLTEIDEPINFLLLIPIYEEEREWCMRNHTLALISRLHEQYEGAEWNADLKRDALLPEELEQEEIDDYHFMTYFGIDEPTYIKLCEFLDKAEEQGIEITRETIESWVNNQRE